jgi:flagellar basal body-associated protein FliL
MISFFPFAPFFRLLWLTPPVDLAPLRLFGGQLARRVGDAVGAVRGHTGVQIDDEQVALHPDGGHGDAHGAPAKPKETVVSLEQFTVNLSTAVGATPKFARVVIAVEVPNEETSRELTQKMPQVRNSIIDLFNSKRPADLQTGEGRNFLKEEIRNALNSFLITGKIKAIFFSNFSVSG